MNEAAVDLYEAVKGEALLAIVACFAHCLTESEQEELLEALAVSTWADGVRMDCLTVRPPPPSWPHGLFALRLMERRTPHTATGTHAAHL